MANFLNPSYKSSPVIAFNTLIDTDLAVVKYCITNNMTDIVNYPKLKTLGYYQLIGLVYRRKCINPLRVIANESVSDEILDLEYEELFKNKEEEILSNATYTDMHFLVKEFTKSTDISPNILCYDEIQRKIIETSDLRSVNVVDTNSARINKSQYYLKYLSDLNKFKDLSYMTFYVSSCGLNLTDENDDLNMTREEVLEFATNSNKISIFDMYRMDIIGSYKSNE
jgi:hypothetical protein